MVYMRSPAAWAHLFHLRSPFTCSFSILNDWMCMLERWGKEKQPVPYCVMNNYSEAVNCEWLYTPNYSPTSSTKSTVFLIGNRIQWHKKFKNEIRKMKGQRIKWKIELRIGMTNCWSLLVKHSTCFVNSILMQINSASLHSSSEIPIPWNLTRSKFLASSSPPLHLLLRLLFVVVSS